VQATTPQNNATGKKDLVMFDCVLCGGNQPENYKGCTGYKELQQKKYPPLRM
jgi:hypothetical protein